MIASWHFFIIYKQANKQIVRVTTIFTILEEILSTRCNNFWERFTLFIFIQKKVPWSDIDRAVFLRKINFKFWFHSMLLRWHMGGVLGLLYELIVHSRMANISFMRSC